MSKTPEDVARAFIVAINAENPNTLRALMIDDHTFTDARGNSFSGADKMRLAGNTSFMPIPAITSTLNTVSPQEIVLRSSAKPREVGVPTILFSHKDGRYRPHGSPRLRKKKSITGQSSATQAGSIHLSNNRHFYQPLTLVRSPALAVNTY